MDRRGLFPACAGVIPRFSRSTRLHSTFPRVCGGDPAIGYYMDYDPAFSPRVRG